jgi:hypothetical protein
MKPKQLLARSLALSGLLACLAAPALAAAAATATGVFAPVRGVSEVPGAPGLAPGMHAEGRGTWRGPDVGLGRLRASTPVAGGPTFLVDASLARIVPMGPHQPGAEGTLWGELLVIDPDAGAQAVANVVGQWMQEEDGRGAFLGHILLATGDPREPVLAVGRVVGTFRTPPPDSGRRQVGLADLRWSVAY